MEKNNRGMRRGLRLRTWMETPQGTKQIGPGQEQQVFLNYLRYSMEFEMGYV